MAALVAGAAESGVVVLALDMPGDNGRAAALYEPQALNAPQADLSEGT